MKINKNNIKIGDTVEFKYLGKYFGRGKVVKINDNFFEKSKYYPCIIVELMTEINQFNYKIGERYGALYSEITKHISKTTNTYRFRQSSIYPRYYEYIYGGSINLCKEYIQQLFPNINNEFDLVVSTVRQKKEGEIKINFTWMTNFYQQLPAVNIKGENIQILKEVGNKLCEDFSTTPDEYKTFYIHVKNI